jgi:hypothetical protein
MKYHWKEGCRLKDSDAAVLGAVIDAAPEITPEWLVEQARPHGSPAHHMFEWDDAVAANAHRIEQARHMIRSLAITVEDRTPIEVRALCHVPSRETYVPHARVFNDVDMRAEVVEQAKREYKALSRKYRVYTELAKVHEAIDAL